jgi:hypothetical protein
MVHLESLIFVLVLMYDALVKHQKSCHSRPRQGFLPAPRLSACAKAFCLRQGFGRQAADRRRAGSNHENGSCYSYKEARKSGI